MTIHLSAETLVMLTTNFKRNPPRKYSRLVSVKPHPGITPDEPTNSVTVASFSRCGRCRKRMDPMRLLEDSKRCVCPGAIVRGPYRKVTS